MPFNVVLTFESVDQILKCDYSVADLDLQIRGRGVVIQTWDKGSGGRSKEK